MSETTAKDLALLAHRAAITEIAEIQQRMALRKVIWDMHGDRALPVREFYYTVLPVRQQVMARAGELRAMEAKSDEERLAKLYGIAKDLEHKFAAMHEATDAVWAEAMAEHFREAFRS